MKKVSIASYKNVRKDGSKFWAFLKVLISPVGNLGKFELKRAIFAAENYGQLF